MFRIISVAAVYFGLLVSGAAFGAMSWSLTSGGTNSGGNNYGNVRTYTADGVTVNASAWAGTGGTVSGPGTLQNRRVIENAYLPSWDGGLGVLNRTENGSSPNHALDNANRFDVILLSFSSQVALDFLSLGWVQNDSDVSVLAWTGVGAPTMGSGSSQTFSAMAQAASGWELVANLSNVGSNPAGATFNTTSPVYSSFWLIGAGAFTSGSGFSNGDGRNDYVKLAAIGASKLPPPPNAVPEPGSLALLALAGVGLVGMRRRPHG